MFLRIALLLFAVIMSGCASPKCQSGMKIPWAGRPVKEPTILVVGVVDLRSSDLERGTLPHLEEMASHSHQWTDVLSEGMGASAAAALLSGRRPLDELRNPIMPLGWTKCCETESRVIHVAPTLASEPELGRWREFTNRVSLTEFAPKFDSSEPGIVVALFDPFVLTEEERRPYVRRDRDAALSQFDLELHNWLESLDDSNLHILVAGIPRAPLRHIRTRVGWSPSETLARLRTPLFWKSPGGRASTDASPMRPQDVIRRIRGLDSRNGSMRIALWWNESGGGVLASRGKRIVVGNDRGQWQLFDNSRKPIERIELSASEPESLQALTAGIAERTIGGTPRLWAAFRGSESVDFINLNIIAAGDSLQWKPWSLEVIDEVAYKTPTHLRARLAGEPQTDGVFVELGWPPRLVECRVTGEMGEAPLLGSPIDVGTGRVRLNMLRITPWSRPFWEATGRAWPSDPDSWWRRHKPGLHLRIASSTTPEPEPIAID